MKKTTKFLAVVVSVLAFLLVGHTASAVTIGLNAASPLGGYDLGDGSFATLIGVQSGSSLLGETITAADLYGTILSGTVDGFYYAAGNAAGQGAFFDNIDEFASFVSDTVIAGPAGTYPNKIWDSLYAVHSDTVVFSNGSGGTNTMSTGGVRIEQNPFESAGAVPIPAPILLLGTGMVGLAGFRKNRKKS